MYTKTKKEQRNSLISVPFSAQEEAILEDLLTCFLGVEGKYICLHPILTNSPQETDIIAEEKINFELDASMDVSLKKLVEQMLPICNYFVQISTFVEQHSAFNHSQTHHAFSDAIRNILKDYMDIVIQLENLLRKGKLTAQVNQLQPKKKN